MMTPLEMKLQREQREALRLEGGYRDFTGKVDQILLGGCPHAKRGVSLSTLAGNTVISFQPPF